MRPTTVPVVRITGVRGQFSEPRPRDVPAGSEGARPARERWAQTPVAAPADHGSRLASLAVGFAGELAVQSHPQVARLWRNAAHFDAPFVVLGRQGPSVLMTAAPGQARRVRARSAKRAS